MTRGVLALVVFFLIAPSPRARAQQRATETPAIVGVWKLNPEKSTMRAVPSDVFELRQYSLRPDGFLVGLLITRDSHGYHYLQFVARTDGKDYPEYSDQIVEDLVAAAKPTPRTYSETAVDGFVTDWIDKINGRVTARGQKIVSKDRKTLTITVDGATGVLVYDRQ